MESRRQEEARERELAAVLRILHCAELGAEAARLVGAERQLVPSDPLAGTERECSGTDRRSRRY